MPEPLGLRAEANQHPGKQKDWLVQCATAKNCTAGRDPALIWLSLLFFFFLFSSDNEMRLREVEDLHTEIRGNQ